VRRGIGPILAIFSQESATQDTISTRQINVNFGCRPLPHWPRLAVLALRRNRRLASHPVLFAKTSHVLIDE
jgi:hypothetical protein